MRLKNDGCDSEVQVILEVDIYRYAPWQLLGTVCLFFILPNLFYFLWIHTLIGNFLHQFSSMYLLFVNGSHFRVKFRFVDNKSGWSEVVLLCQHDEYKNADRANRAINFGYWKDTGVDCHIKSNKRGLICIKTTLVYHTGPKGLHTNCVMHEYHASGPHQV